MNCKNKVKLLEERELQQRKNKMHRTQIYNLMPIIEIYILTTCEYDKDYLYKIGKSSNTSKRLKTLNTSRLKDDEIYICYIAKCYDANTVESFIHKCLSRQHYENNREFFAMKFERLVAVVDIACTSRESDYEKILKLLE